MNIRGRLINEVPPAWCHTLFMIQIIVSWIVLGSYLAETASLLLHDSPRLDGMTCICPYENARRR